MRVAVTGGMGFIGQYICEALEARDHDVLVVDHHSVETDRQLFLADVRDATAITEVVAHVDGVIHLAAVLGTQETITNPRPAAETNILGSLNVFEAANQYDVPVVYAGVGNHWMRNHGTGAYTISKTAAEDFARMHVKFRGSRISIVRPVNAYGPRQSIAHPYGTSRVRKIMPAFICRALTGTDIEIYGNGTQISDCVYVKDVAEVFVRALEKTASSGPLETPVEVGPAYSHTVNDVAALVAKTVSEKTGKQRVNRVHLPMRPGEVPNAVVSADHNSLHQVDVSPSDFVSLEEGISRTVDWYQKFWLPEYAAANGLSL